MDDAATDRMIAGMVGKDGAIWPDVRAEVLRTAFGMSIEAHGPHAGVVALDLGAKDAVSSETSVAAGDGVRAYAPPTGSPFHSVLAMETAGGTFVFAVEWGGKPNPAVDAILDDVLKIRARARRPRSNDAAPDHADAFKFAAYALRSGGVDGLVSDVVSGAYRSDLLFSAMSSFAASGPDGDWVRSGTNLTAKGADRWREFFATLATTFDGVGQPGRADADARVFGLRRWRRLGAGMENYDAAFTFGDAVAGREGYLPGAAAAEWFAALDRIQVALDFERLLARGLPDRIHAVCSERGYASGDGEFSFNDLDDHVYAETYCGGRRLFFRDQSRRTVLAMPEGRDGTYVVSSLARDLDGEVAEIARLRVSGDAVAAELAVDWSADAARAWNSFVNVVESADCCLGEEPASAPAP